MENEAVARRVDGRPPSGSSDGAFLDTLDPRVGGWPSSQTRDDLSRLPAELRLGDPELYLSAQFGWL